MDAWIGLAGVIAGALIAFSGQYLMRRSETREHAETLLLEQAAVIIALAEDHRNRVWEERTQVAGNVVAAWDIGTYRLAEARLRILAGEPGFLQTLEQLHESGTALGKAWRFEPRDDQAVDAAWQANRQAIENFAAASSRLLRRTASPRRYTTSETSSQPVTAASRLGTDPGQPPTEPDGRPAAAAK